MRYFVRSRFSRGLSGLRPVLGGPSVDRSDFRMDTEPTPYTFMPADGKLKREESFCVIDPPKFRIDIGLPDLRPPETAEDHRVYDSLMALPFNEYFARQLYKSRGQVDRAIAGTPARIAQAKKVAAKRQALGLKQKEKEERARLQELAKQRIEEAKRAKEQAQLERRQEQAKRQAAEEHQRKYEGWRAQKWSEWEWRRREAERMKRAMEQAERERKAKEAHDRMLEEIERKKEQEERERRKREEQMRERMRREQQERIWREQQERIWREQQERIRREEQQKRERMKREQEAREQRKREQERAYERQNQERKRREAEEMATRRRQQKLREEAIAPGRIFDEYEAKWTQLLNAQLNRRWKFLQIPWPVRSVVKGPEQLTPREIRDFILHPIRLSRKNINVNDRRAVRRMVLEEVRRWHADKFTNTTVSKVIPEDQTAVAEAGLLVTKYLNAIVAEYS